MTHIDVEQIVRRQIRLYERAHQDSMELKPLGYAFRRAGVDTTKLYVNPRFILLPFEECPHLNRLSSQQMSRLTAAYYGALYSDAARHETRVIRYNLEIADRVFPRYSDDYMLLFSESDEEFDHVTTFRCVCQTALSPSDRRWRGLHSASEEPEVGDPAYQGLDAALDRLGPKLDQSGYGALYLLHRFLLNLMLKQTESFMHRNLGSGPYTEDDYSPLALEITRAHETDEARHFTTSLEIGLGLLAQATPEARRLVRNTISMFTASFIAERFAEDPKKTQIYARTQLALREALRTPEFANFGATAEQLAAFWQRADIAVPQREEYQNSLRWLACEVNRLIERAELRIPQSAPLERLRQFLQS